jgi:peptidoglycan-associated lipoprotein
VFEDSSNCPTTSSLASCQPTLLPENSVQEMPVEAALLPKTAAPESLQEPKASVSESVHELLLVDGHTTFFSYDSAELSIKAQSELSKIAAFLAKSKDGLLIVEGHCDERGSRDYNLALGDRRAVFVRDYLVANGVDQSRIKTVSFGKERPVAVGVGPEVWTRNRRAVIRQLQKQ